MHRCKKALFRSLKVHIIRRHAMCGEIIGVHSSRGLGGRSMHKIYDVRHHHSSRS